jgi:hypothetical protein
MPPRPANLIISLASATCLLAVFASFGFAAWKFDWGNPQIKLLTILAMAFLPVWLSKVQPAAESDRLHKLSCALAVLAVAVSSYTFFPKYKFSLATPPGNDIGQTTMRASFDFWTHGKNPYDRDDLNPRPELQQRFRGFHYGPGMLLAFPQWGTFKNEIYRLTLILWTLIMLIASALLASSMASGSPWSRASAGLFCLAAISTWEISWREFGTVGVNDPAPLALMLLSLLMASKNRWGVAGLLMGLSFACKFSPALFAMAALARITTPKKFWVGLVVTAGLIIVPFLIATPHPSFDNIFLSRLAIAINPTSLYHHAHPSAHLIISALFPATALLLITRNFLALPTLDSVMKTLCLLMAAGVMSHREIHANHLLWLAVACACLVSMGRYRLFDGILPPRPALGTSAP